MALFLFAPISHAVTAPNSIYFNPEGASFDLADGVGSLDLWMNFSEATSGGGIDLVFNGSVSFLGFSESSVWGNGSTAIFDKDFNASGHSTDLSDFDYEIHVANFSAAGIVGQHFIGVVDFSLESVGPGSIDLLFNPFGGDFQGLSIDLKTANIEVSSVPVPAAVWFMISGIATLGAFSRRKIA